MRRYRAFDPPEYVDWTADPEILQSYRRRIQDDPQRAELVGALEEREKKRIAAIKAGELFKAEIDESLRAKGVLE
jgi:hypothetical protein